MTLEDDKNVKSSGGAVSRACGAVLSEGTCWRPKKQQAGKINKPTALGRDESVAPGSHKIWGQLVLDRSTKAQRQYHASPRCQVSKRFESCKPEQIQPGGALLCFD